MEAVNQKPEKVNRKFNLTNLNWGSRPAQTTLLILLLVSLTFIAWRSINYISGGQPSPDSSVFSSVATHLMGGRVLYRDIWDHKPPMVYIINLCALAAGDGTINSIRFMERVFAVVGGLLLFWMVFTAFGNKWLAFLTTLFFLVHMYHPATFSRGNLVTEYGGVFLIGGMAAAFASRHFKGGLGTAMAFIAGFVLSLAVLTKEPFVLSALPWFFYIAWPRKSNWKQAMVRAGLFVIGALMPVVVFAIWLLVNGALSDWIEVIRYNFVYAAGTPGRPDSFDLLLNVKMAYEKMAEVMSITRIAAGLGLVCLLDRSFVRKYHCLPVAISVSAVLSFIATSIGRYHAHYYMQLVPSYVLLGTCGLAFVFDLLRRAEVQPVTVTFILLGTLVFADGMNLKNHANRLAKPARRWEGDALTQFISNNCKWDDTIWAPFPGNTHLYLTTGRLSPTKWLYVFDHLFLSTCYSTKEEKLTSLRSDLERNPPRLIVINRKWGSFIERHNLSGWLKSNYKIGVASKSNGLQVWVYAK